MTPISSSQFFLFAGEPSGDLHGHHLMKAIKGLSPTVSFSGVGGPKMRSLKFKPLLRMEDFAVMGFTDVFFSFPKLYRQFYIVRDAILNQQPTVVILIDYPDFNLRLAKSLRKKGYLGKIIHYISPSVWAWRKSRIHSMAKTLDLLLTIYPFEKAHYESTSLNVKFVGNPLSEYIAKYQYQESWKSKLHIPKNAPLIALFPGSRHGEILRNLQLQLEAAAQLLQKFPTHIFAISCADQKQEKVILEAIKGSQFQLGKNIFVIPKAYTYELMRDSQTAVAKSGTVTLELALHHRPTVVIYKLEKLNHFLAKYVIRLNLPHYCIANIIAGKSAYPELINKGLTSSNIFKNLLDLDQNVSIRHQCLSECLQISQQLSIPNASQVAAKAVLDLYHSGAV